MTTTLRLFHASAVALALLLAGCGSPGANTSLYSVRQPVVERTTHTLDLTLAGDELPSSERARLASWFAALELGYADRVIVEGGLPAAAEVRAIATAHGVLPVNATLGSATDAEPGKLRVSVQRSRAHVPHCPDWSANSTASFDNSTSPGFGCSVNGNLATMVADPEHLLAGSQATGETVIMTASKAIASYRALEPTGSDGLSNVSSQGTGDE